MNRIDHGFANIAVHVVHQGFVGGMNGLCVGASLIISGGQRTGTRERFADVIESFLLEGKDEIITAFNSSGHLKLKDSGTVGFDLFVQDRRSIALNDALNGNPFIGSAGDGHLIRGEFGRELGIQCDRQE